MAADRGTIFDAASDVNVIFVSRNMIVYRNRAMMRLYAAAIVFLISGICPLSGQEIANIRGAMGSAMRVNGYTQTDVDCNLSDPPLFFIEKPPLHGALCRRPARMLLTRAVANNLIHCLNRPLDGLEILYIPDTDFVGRDEANFTVTFRAGVHVVDVDATVLPGPGTQSKAPASKAAGQFQFPDGRRQERGPIPSCFPPQTSMLAPAP